MPEYVGLGQAAPTLEAKSLKSFAVKLISLIVWAGAIAREQARIGKRGVRRETGSAENRPVVVDQRSPALASRAAT